VAAGKARDAVDAADITLAAAIIKSLSAWAVGSGNGGLDTGAVAASTYYYIWLIKRTDTSVVDVLFSLSGTAPTMPANYTVKRCIGRFRTNGSSQVDPLAIISANPANRCAEVITATRAFVQPPWAPDYKMSIAGGGAVNSGVGGWGAASAGSGIKWIRGQAAGTSTTVTIGAAGATSSFGAAVTCTGASGAVSNGNCSGADINIPGEAGLGSFVGGGGYRQGGNGGGTLFGPGGGTITGSNGQPGIAFGSGGGGCGADADGIFGFTNGASAPGGCIIEF